MSLIKKIFIPLVLFNLISIILFYNAYAYYSKNLPNIHEIINYKPKTITKIYDKNNKLIGLFFDEKREFRNINKIPPTITRRKNPVKVAFLYVSNILFGCFAPKF